MAEILFDYKWTAGYILAALLGLWKIWTYYNDHRERIKFNHEYSVGVNNPDGTITIKMSNIGKTSVYIKSVSLVHEHLGDINADKNCRVQETGGSLSFTLNEGKRDPLAPGDSCAFELPNALIMGCKKLSKIPSKNIWIDIHSGKARLAHIQDSQIHQYVCWIAKRIEEIELEKTPDQSKPLDNIFKQTN